MDPLAFLARVLVHIHGEGLATDVLLAGINGPRLRRHDYDRRLLMATDCQPFVIPTNRNTFMLPYGVSQQANIERNPMPFVDVAWRVSPAWLVIIPVHFEPGVVL